MAKFSTVCIQVLHLSAFSISRFCQEIENFTFWAQYTARDLIQHGYSSTSHLGESCSLSTIFCALVPEICGVQQTPSMFRMFTQFYLLIESSSLFDMTTLDYHPSPASSRPEVDEATPRLEVIHDQYCMSLKAERFFCFPFNSRWELTLLLSREDTASQKYAYIPFSIWKIEWMCFLLDHMRSHPGPCPATFHLGSSLPRLPHSSGLTWSLHLNSNNLACFKTPKKYRSWAIDKSLIPEPGRCRRAAPHQRCRSVPRPNQRLWNDLSVNPRMMTGE